MFYFCKPTGCHKPLLEFMLIRDGEVSKPYTIQDLVVEQPTLYPDTVVVQALGFLGRNGSDVFEGDVLELEVTEELYDSDLGQPLRANPNATSILCVMEHEKRYAGCDYAVYFKTEDGVLQNENGPIKQHGGKDDSFPRYLCEKGALCKGNVVADPNLLFKTQGGGA